MSMSCKEPQPTPAPQPGAQWKISVGYNFAWIMRLLTNYAKSCDLRSIMRNCNIAEYQKPCKNAIFGHFQDFQDQISSNLHKVAFATWQCMPFFPPASCLMTFLLRHAQKLKFWEKVDRRWWGQKKNKGQGSSGAVTGGTGVNGLSLCGGSLLCSCC